MVREHEHGMVVRRVVAPPTPPVGVAPVAADGTEHVAAQDPGADSGEPGNEEVLVDAVLAAALADHLAPELGLEDPLVETLTTGAERILEPLVGAGAVAVERDREVVDAQSGHRCSSGSGASMTSSRPRAHRPARASEHRGARRVRLPLLGLAALEELAPAARLDLDVVLAGRGPDPAPCPITLGVAHALDLIEPRDGIPYVLGVRERLLALLGERERAVRQLVLPGRRQDAARRARPGARTGAASAPLCGAGLLEVLAGGLLLLRRRHFPPPRSGV